MDDVCVRFSKTNDLVTARDILDATRRVQTGTKEMLISAISLMPVKSNAFNFVDFEDYGSAFVLGSFLADPGGSPVPAGFGVPNYYVRGAITQLDSGVIAESIGIGIEQTNPEVVALVRDRFASMSGQERVSFAQRALNGQGLDQVDQLLSASARGNLASSRVSVTVTD